MAMNTTTNTAAENAEFYQKSLLERLKPNLVFYKYGVKKKLPKNSGDTTSFRRFETIPTSGTTLSEGVTPTGTTYDVSKIKTTIEQMGNFVTITDKLDMIGLDKNVAEASEALGETAGLELDQFIYKKIKVGTNVLYAGGKTSEATIATTDVMTVDLVSTASRILRRKNVKKQDGISYIALIHPDVAHDLTKDPEWKDVNKYNQGGKAIYENEVGKIGGVRFIESTVAEPTTVGNVKVYHTFVFGAEAYGVVDVDGGDGAPRIIVKPMGSAGSSDPLEQRGTVGYKLTNAAVILNELALLRVVTSSSMK